MKTFIGCAIASLAFALIAGCGGGSSEPSAMPPQGPAGTLDPAFGSGGLVVTVVNLNAVPAAMASRADGKIVIAGYTMEASRTSLLLLRYREDGTIDSSFGQGGIVVTRFGNSDSRADGVALQADGKVVVVGHSETSCAVFRYLDSGVLDPSFGAGGIVEFGDQYFGVGCGNVAFQADGRIVVNGSMALFRFGIDGSRDMSFAGPNPGYCLCDLAVQGDDRLVVSGNYFHGGMIKFLAVNVGRANQDGTPDTSFATLSHIGEWGTDIPRYLGGRLALLKDGKIVVTVDEPKDDLVDAGAHLIRLLPDGTMDPEFGSTGEASSNLPGTARAVALQANGKIVVAGAGKPGLAVTRFNPDGKVDETFGTNGIVTTTYGSKDLAYAVAVRPDGRILVAANTYTSPPGLLVARYFGDPVQ